MKKVKNTKLTFNKNTISQLQETAVKGGVVAMPNTPATWCYLSCERKCKPLKTRQIDGQ